MPSSRSYPDLDRSPKKNWVENAGGLPSYIERIAKHLHYEGGHPISTAIAMAVSTVKRWAAGGNDVKPDTRAKAAAAVAAWEKLKGKARAKKAGKAIAEAMRKSYTMTEYEATQIAESMAKRLYFAEAAALTLTQPTATGVTNARALLEADVSERVKFTMVRGEATDVEETRVALRDEIELLEELIEALAPPVAKKGIRPKEQAQEQEQQQLDPGTRTMHLQRRLTSLGHAAVSDGQFGPKTDKAVKDFQKKAGLKDDGIVGPKTSDALRNAPDPDDEDDTDGWGDLPAPGDTQADGSKADGEAEEKFTPGATLHKGMGVGEEEGSDDVKKMQSELGVEADGAFGPETHKAVKRFQRKHGLNPDGIVGAKTQRTMHGANKGKKMAEAFLSEHRIEESENHADDELWSKCKAEAKRKSSGKPGVWTMALANKLYRKRGGSYKGDKGSDAKGMSSSANKLNEALRIMKAVHDPYVIAEANKGLEAMIAALMAKGMPEAEATAVAAKNISGGGKPGMGAKRGSASRGKIGKQAERKDDGEFADKGTGVVRGAARPKPMKPKAAKPKIVPDYDSAKSDGTTPGRKAIINNKSVPLPDAPPSPRAMQAAAEKHGYTGDLGGLSASDAQKLMKGELDNPAPKKESAAARRRAAAARGAKAKGPTPVDSSNADLDGEYVDPKNLKVGHRVQMDTGEGGGTVVRHNGDAIHVQWDRDKPGLVSGHHFGDNTDLVHAPKSKPSGSNASGGDAPKTPIKSYDPKKGPSAAEKKANAEKMFGTGGKKGKPSGSNAPTGGDHAEMKHSEGREHVRQAFVHGKDLNALDGATKSQIANHVTNRFANDDFNSKREKDMYVHVRAKMRGEKTPSEIKNEKRRAAAAKKKAAAASPPKPPQSPGTPTGGDDGMDDYHQSLANGAAQLFNEIGADDVAEKVAKGDTAAGRAHLANLRKDGWRPQGETQKLGAAQLADLHRELREKKKKKLAEADARADMPDGGKSKADDSPGRCASCGKRMPKKIKENRRACPFCGKRVKADPDA